MITHSSIDRKMVLMVRLELTKLYVLNVAAVPFALCHISIKLVAPNGLAPILFAF